MAKIPENTSYTTGADSNQTERPVSIASYSGALRALRGRPSPVAGSTPAGFAETGRKQFAAGELSVPIAKAIAPTPTQRYSPLPSSYSGFVNPYRPEEEVPTPSGAVVRSLPGITEGQYIVSPEKPGELFKSARGYIPEEKALILGNRPSNLYQVDHIIPIWAGGADTESNKQVLPINKHDDKTKAQSVPLTLLANNKINLAQARLMAMQWDKYDISDVPDAKDTQGMLPLQVAEEIQKRWADQEAHPRISWKDFLAAVPESTKGLDKSGLPVPIREAAKGIVSGVTGGWVPYQPGEDAGIVGTGAGIIGNVAGMLLPVTAFSRMIGGLSKTASGVATARGWISAAPSIEKATKIANFAQSGRIGSTIVKNIAYGNLARNTGAMVLYGQLSRDGFEGRTSNFLENLGYAAASGIMPPSIKGAVGAAVAATSIGLMADPQDPQSALVNGLVIGALHTAGIKGTKINIERGLAQAKQALEDEAARAANNVLSPYVGKRLPFLKPEDPIPPHAAYKEGDILSIREEALNKVNQLAASDTIDFETAARERARILVATNQLSRRTIPETERGIKMVQDLMSVKNQAEKLTDSTLTTPPIVKKVADTMEESWMKNSFRAHDVDTPTGENPVGTIRLSGLGASDLNEAGAAYYLAAKAEGRASPTLIAISTPEYESIMRAISNAYTPEQIAQKLQKPMMNPQNSMPVYGIVNEVNGTKTVVRVGWTPRKFKVGHPDVTQEQGKYSFNQSAYAKDMAKKGTPLPGTDWALNKDTLTEGLNRTGSRVLFLNYVDGGIKAAESGKPWIITSINDENWKASVDFMRRLQGADKNVGIPSLIKQINNTRDAKQKAALIANIKERVKRDADDVLKDAPFTTADPLVLNARETTENMLTTIKEAVNQDSPEAIRNSFAKKLTLHLTPEEAADLFARKGTLSAKDALKFVTNVVNQGRSEPGVREVLSQFVIPYLRSTEFRSWELGKTFLNIKLLGGMEPKVATTPARFGTEEIKFFKKQGFTDEMIADLAARGKEKAPGGFVAAPTTARTTPVSTQAMPTVEPAQTVQPTIKLKQPEVPAPKAEVAPVPPPQAEAVVAPQSTPPKAVIPPTRDRIVDRIVSGRAKTPIQAVQGAPGRTETPKMTQTPPVVKQVISGRGLEPKSSITEESEQFILQGQDGMDNIVVPSTEKYSIAQYEKQYDAEISRALQAAKAALLGRRDLDSKSINQIQQNIKTDLERYKEFRLGSEAYVSPEVKKVSTGFIKWGQEEIDKVITQNEVIDQKLAEQKRGKTPPGGQATKEEEAKKVRDAAIRLNKDTDFVLQDVRNFATKTLTEEGRDKKAIFDATTYIERKLEEHKKNMLSGGEKEPPREYLEEVPSELFPSKEGPGAVTSSVDSIFNNIDEGLKKDKTSPAYFYATAQDEGFRALLGADYKKDPTLREVLPRFYRDIFFNPVTEKGMPITQPAEVIEAAAAFGGRSPEYFAAIDKSRVTPKGATAEEKMALTKAIEKRGPLQFVPKGPTVSDLVYGESALMPGIGAEGPLTQTGIVRDVLGLFLNPKTGLRDQLQKASGRSLPGISFKKLEQAAQEAEIKTTKPAKTPEQREATQAIKPLIEKYKMLVKAVSEEPEKVYLAESLEDTRAAIQKYMNILGITKKAE